MDKQSRSGVASRWRPPLRHGALTATITVLVVAAGCGGPDADSSSDAGAPAPDASTSTSTSTARPLQHQPGNAANAAAREAGRRACRGTTPLEAADRFKAAARRAGVKKRFAELVTEPAPSVAESPGYPRLVGAFYATTVPPPLREQAAAGCAEELAAH